MQLGRIQTRIWQAHQVPFTYDDEVIKLIVSRCTELESGGRMIDAILTNTVLPRISEEFLVRSMEGKTIERVHVSVREGAFLGSSRTKSNEAAAVAVRKARYLLTASQKDLTLSSEIYHHQYLTQDKLKSKNYGIYRETKRASLAKEFRGKKPGEF